MNLQDKNQVLGHLTLNQEQHNHINSLLSVISNMLTHKPFISLSLFNKNKTLTVYSPKDQQQKVYLNTSALKQFKTCNHKIWILDLMHKICWIIDKILPLKQVLKVQETQITFQKWKLKLQMHMFQVHKQIK